MSIIFITVHLYMLGVCFHVKFIVENTKQSLLIYVAFKYCVDDFFDYSLPIYFLKVSIKEEKEAVTLNDQ